MTAARTAQRLDAGTYRCPQCGVQYQALGTETALYCDGGGRHKPTAMTPLIDVTDHESDR